VPGPQWLLPEPKVGAAFRGAGFREPGAVRHLPSPSRQHQSRALYMPLPRTRHHVPGTRPPCTALRDPRGAPPSPNPRCAPAPSTQRGTPPSRGPGSAPRCCHPAPCARPPGPAGAAPSPPAAAVPSRDRRRAPPSMTRAVSQGPGAMRRPTEAQGARHSPDTQRRASALQGPASAPPSRDPAPAPASEPTRRAASLRPCAMPPTPTQGARRPELSGRAQRLPIPAEPTKPVDNQLASLDKRLYFPHPGRGTQLR
jgi:hypothetical protein